MPRLLSLAKLSWHVQKCGLMATIEMRSNRISKDLIFCRWSSTSGLTFGTACLTSTRIKEPELTSTQPQMVKSRVPGVPVNSRVGQHLYQSFFIEICMSGERMTLISSKIVFIATYIATCANYSCWRGNVKLQNRALMRVMCDADGKHTEPLLKGCVILMTEDLFELIYVKLANMLPDALLRKSN